MVSVKETLDEAIEALKKSDIDNPNLDARILLQEAMGHISQSELFMAYKSEISTESLKTFKAMLERRLANEPVGRIIGRRAFWKHEFKISTETLEPRPDTEILIEKVLQYCGKDKPLKILDLGTGSGCILISLLQEITQATGIGADISKNALETAKQNAYDAKVHERIEFINNSWNDLYCDGSYDVVVSNPPYIKSSDIDDLLPEVKSYDPIAALDGGEDGLDCYREIVSLLPKLLKENGWVFFEIGYNQKQEVNDMLAKGGFTVVENATDLAGNDRCVIARWSK